MYTAINGVYENGVLELDETPPTTKKIKVIVTFLEEVETASPKKRVPGGLLRLGHLKGKKLSIPEDFNSPLEDLKDYM